MTTKRMERAHAKAARLTGRLSALDGKLRDPSLDEAAREQALVELESLVLVSRGSSEADHRAQLTLGGLQAAFEIYLAPAAPQASAYATSSDQDALLAEEALRELRGEYPEDAERLSVAEIAAAVRQWALRYAATT